MVTTDQIDNENQVDELDSSKFEASDLRKTLDYLVNQSQSFRQMSLNLSRYLHQKLINNGQDAREATDLLHGKPLGHPLHPVLTDLTIGSWTLGLFFDILSIIPGFRKFRNIADNLTGLGTLTAIPTALTGMVDYSTIKQDAVHYGATHGLLSGIAFFFYIRSVISRIAGKRTKALLFSAIGMSFASMASWLGGELVYRHRVGVNHSPEIDIDEWTAVLSLDDLEEGTPTRAEVGDSAVLLFRHGDEVYAINAICSHAGGPLDKGNIVNDVCIECPWHQSVFDMRTGDVIHSPATYKQPSYEVRIHDSEIEIRTLKQPDDDATVYIA